MPKQHPRATVPRVEKLEDRTTPTTLNALDGNGINILGLDMTGQGVKVGMIDPGRPGLTDHNLVGAPALAAVYDGDQAGQANN